MIVIKRDTDINMNIYDENWMIVRKPKDLPAFVKHEPLLSPSPDLFKKYRDAFHSGCFDQEYFDTIYVPQFLEELSKNNEALLQIHTLVKLSKEKNILLACYCENESMCHRSIIAGILLGLGAEIETNSEYYKYYEMFILN